MHSVDRDRHRRGDADPVLDRLVEQEGVIGAEDDAGHASGEQQRRVGPASDPGPRQRRQMAAAAAQSATPAIETRPTYHSPSRVALGSRSRSVTGTSLV